jgi:Protein of unknown function (DUF1592)/Protein of unknown function (DUF1588)/Protein of unknown function (DUF1595)/Protein of unknown function (DUF1587)/Protein of unknown function (DUF1585)
VTNRIPLRNHGFAQASSRRTWRARSIVATWATVAAICGCTGAIDGDGPNGSRPDTPLNPSGGGAPGPEPLPLSPAEAAGYLPFRRLTREEYNYTVQDLLSDASAPASRFDADGQGSSGFEDPGIVSLADVKDFTDAASQLSTAAAAKPGVISSCGAGAAAEDACFATWLPDFALKAYRRPIRSEESARLTALYTTAKTDLQYSFQERLRVVLSAMLQSPNFLYHWEIDGDPASGSTPVALDSYALASRLSYFVFRSLPDTQLFDAAKTGKLKTIADVEREARRMLTTDKARRGVESFYVQWLGIRQLPDVQRDQTAFPAWTPTLFSAAVDETKAFVDDAVLADGKLSTLFGASYSFLNDALAKVYGVAGVTGSALQRTPLPTNQRTGILTQLSFLSMYPAGSPTKPPVLRGKFVYTHVFCQPMAPPGMVPKLDPPPPGLPLRQHFEEHSKNPVCASCHRILDPIGFVFENYSSIGQFRTQDTAGQTVDPKGTLEFPESGTHNFVDAVDFAGQIAKSPELPKCQATQWLRFALARHEATDDQGSLDQASKRLASTGDLREMLVALATSKTFMNRLPGVGESTP